MSEQLSLEKMAVGMLLARYIVLPHPSPFPHERPPIWMYSNYMHTCCYSFAMELYPNALKIPWRDEKLSRSGVEKLLGSSSHACSWCGPGTSEGFVAPHSPPTRWAWNHIVAGCLYDCNELLGK